GLVERWLLADQRQLLAQSELKRLIQWKAALLPNADAILGGAAADFAIDPVERSNACQDFEGDRRGAALDEFVKVPTDMAPAEGKLHIAPFGQHLVAGIAVDLQHARETGEVSYRPRRFSIRGVDIGHDRWIRAAPCSVI